MATRSGEVATQQPWPLAYQHPWPLAHQQSVAPSKWPLTLWGPWPLPPVESKQTCHTIMQEPEVLSGHIFRESISLFQLRITRLYEPLFGPLVRRTVDQNGIFSIFYTYEH